MFIAHYPVRFSDIDAASIVYYPRFFYYCHQAFEDFFNEKFTLSYANLILQRKLGFPAVNINCDYKKPLAFGDIAKVSIKVKNIGNSSLTCAYEIGVENSNELHFTAQITTVCVEMNSKKSFSIPSDIRDFLQKYKSE